MSWKKQCILDQIQRKIQKVNKLKKIMIKAANMNRTWEQRWSFDVKCEPLGNSNEKRALLPTNRLIWCQNGKFSNKSDGKNPPRQLISKPISDHEIGSYY